MVNERDVMFWMLSSSIFSKPLTDEQKKYINADVLNRAFQLAFEHSMPHLFLSAIKLNGFTDICPDIIPKAKKAVYFATITMSMQQEELKKLVALFEENKIPFIVLKGTVMRELYPEPWMRICCDMDILVKNEDFERARRLIVEKLDYKSEKVMTHDVSMAAKSGIHIELHFKLIENRAALAKNVLERVWEESSPKYEGSYERVMSDEMFYLFHIAHASKHFEEGGCGLRPLIDVYLLNKTENPNRKKLLDEARLTTFAQALSRIANERFGKEFASFDEMTQKVEDFIIAGKTFGTVKSNYVTYAVTKGKAEKIRVLLFPDYDKMALLFPVLKKHKLLLPFMWIYRWLNALFEGRGKISKDRIMIAKNLKQESIDEAAQLLKSLDLI